MRFLDTVLDQDTVLDKDRAPDKTVVLRWATFPARAAVAVGRASLGVATLVAPGGPLDRLLAAEGAIDRLLAPGGVVDRLGDLVDAIDRLEPAIESLGPILDGVREAASGIDSPVRGPDRSARRRRAAAPPRPEERETVPAVRISADDAREAGPGLW
jgi:hypothetical protein